MEYNLSFQFYLSQEIWNSQSSIDAAVQKQFLDSFYDICGNMVLQSPQAEQYHPLFGSCSEGNAFSWQLPSLTGCTVVGRVSREGCLSWRLLSCWWRKHQFLKDVVWVKCPFPGRFWRQVGGHLRLVESNSRGVVWGIGYDHTAWAYTGGYGGGFIQGTAQQWEIESSVAAGI